MTMVKWNNKEYSGNIITNKDDVLTVVIYTVESLQDICLSLEGVTEITEIRDKETENTFKVSTAISVKMVEAHTYHVAFSTKPTYQQEIQAKIQEQSDAIDALLVMLLEG